MKKILIAEGNSYLCYYLKEVLRDYGPKIVSNIEDLVYYVFYDDTVFKNIVIGDELIQTNLCFGVDKEVDFELEKLKKCKYYPVTLGEICRVLSKKAKKPEPCITIMSTFNFYPFDRQIVPLDSGISNYIKNHNMSFIDKNSNIRQGCSTEAQFGDIMELFETQFVTK